MTLLTRASLTASKVAARDAGADRKHTQLHIEDDGAAVATNGRILLAVGPAPKPGEAWPAFENAEDVPEGGVGLTLDQVQELLRNLPKGDLGLELGYAQMVKPRAPDGVAFVTTDLKQTRTNEAKKATARFPEWQAALRKVDRNAGAGQMCLHRRDLIQLLQAMEEASPDSDSAVFIQFGDDTDAMLLRSVNYQTGQHVVGMIVPLDTDGDWLRKDDWELKVFEKKRVAPKRKK